MVDFLRDESNFTGHAEKMEFPRSEEDLIKIINDARSAGASVTLSGGRTGIAGGGVPLGGWLVSYEVMNRFLGLRYDRDKDLFYLRCEPGVLLKDLKESVSGRGFKGSGDWDEVSLKALDILMGSEKAYFYPPDPTEDTSQIGGNLACNASGARTYKYGPTRDHVNGLRVVLSDGSVASLKRGEQMAKGEKGKISSTAGKNQGGQTEKAQTREVVLSDIGMPKTKNAAGYYVLPDMDMIDLFIGSEGTLGAFSEIEVILRPVPEREIEIAIFFDDEDKAIVFPDKIESELSCIGSIEYLCPRSIEFLRQSGVIEEIGLAIPPETTTSLIFITLEGGANEVDSQLANLPTVLSKTGALMERTLVAFGSQEKQKFKDLRHALPEMVNSLIAHRKQSHPIINKLSTDHAVSREKFIGLYRLYKQRAEEEDLEYAIWGHLGDDHIHMNILPKNEQEFELGKELTTELAIMAVEMGGTVSAEHGLGKLKRDLLKIMYPDPAYDILKNIKDTLDPQGMFGPGTLFPTKDK